MPADPAASAATPSPGTNPSVSLRVFVEPQQGATYADQLAVARAAEDLGYEAFFRSDHYLKMGDVSGLPGPTDAWLTLAGLARETSSIRLGTLLTSVTFRHLGPLAISLAQADVESASAPGGTRTNTPRTASRSLRSASGSTCSRTPWGRSSSCGPHPPATLARSGASASISSTPPVCPSPCSRRRP